MFAVYFELRLHDVYGFLCSRKRNNPKSHTNGVDLASLHSSCKQSHLQRLRIVCLAMLAFHQKKTNSCCLCGRLTRWKRTTHAVWEAGSISQHIHLVWQEKTIMTIKIIVPHIVFILGPFNVCLGDWFKSAVEHQTRRGSFPPKMCMQ